MENGWIKVEDMLPEITNEKLGCSDEVLAYADNLYGKFFISRYDHEFETWEYERGHDATYNPITHWIPLPKPPTE